MKSIFKTFQELKNQPQTSDDSFVITSLPFIKNHKIGITQVNQPIFFIKCTNNTKTNSLDSNLEYISVQYNRQCQLIDENKKEKRGRYTIISLKSDSDNLQEYFLKIVFVFIKNISEEPSLKELKNEIEKLINLFNRFSRPPLKTIQGLWAELLIIEQSKNPDYLIKSWHISTSDKFDFNDGIDKIEVKSTSKNRRIHNFSLEQLTPNTNSNLIIASILTTETGVGDNIFDLMKKIKKKVRDKKLGFNVDEVIANTLGKDFEKSFDVFYDYQLGVDSIKYYNEKDIPSIREAYIPPNILNVKFDCDLTNIKEVRKVNTKSELHNSLFKKLK